MDWITFISLALAVLSTVIAVYQWAVINESNKTKRELQYLLAGVNNAALQKQMAWQNQINTLDKFESRQDWDTGRLYLRERDDFAELAQLATALEGVIDTDNSAIESMMDRAISMVEKNNKLQSHGLKNPTNVANKTDVEGGKESPV
ncbi:hypothetical protein [Photobacterium indicum]|uniref:Uncharacterized protein n=1 Tax=Photobacterium indicum TaxID=81447 RepID=A0A2T3LAE2_9GAMM|nr:hypothetical protein [Photobacterium indicum]PSV48305.1 hypothetical protein C9J47_07195 [Photobacterium indicum]